MQPSRSKRVAVIACTKLKRVVPSRAIELYDRSPLFRLSLDAAREDGLHVLILSSKYGLVNADKLLQSYEIDLAKMSDSERASWQEALNHQARELLADQGVQEVVALAGADYRKALRAACAPLKIRVSTHQQWERIYKTTFKPSTRSL